MRFNKISFHNYRCFVSGEVAFSEDGKTDKNINLVLGSNGSGKTEVLFSFIWVLYGFDFKTLKGKEDTPYALNTELYRLLSHSAPGTVEECWVEVELEDEKNKYFVKRTAAFEKRGSKVIARPEERVLSYELENHERSLPIRADEQIDAVLQRVIPKSTLVGLVFDGERMQRLSRVDSSSKQTVRGVIRDITNMELLSLCKEVLNDAKESVRRNFRGKGLSKQAIERELSDLASIESQANLNIAKLEPSLDQLREQLERNKDEIEDIRAELEKNQHSRELAIEQRGYDEQRKAAQDELESAYEDLEASLSDGYLLCANKLFDDVAEAIETSNVPEGLLASSVESILSRPACICGRPLDEAAVKALKTLVEQLPPNNINNTLWEWVRSLRISAIDVRNGAKRNNERVRRQDKNIIDSSECIKRISNQLAESPIEEVGHFEERKRELDSEVATLEILIANAECEIEGSKRQLDHASSRQRELSEKHSELKGVQVQIDFYEKALLAIRKIQQHQEAEALSQINDKLEKAYRLISEDAKMGRGLYLVCFHSQKKFQLVAYSLKAYEERYSYLKLRGDIDKKASSQTEAEIREEIILQCVESSSTGQSKINTLAFVKAILDYSNEDKRDGVLEISKNYPLLIDAPFGDIFDDNLILSSKALHTFASQIILMLADESYENVAEQIGSHVSTKTCFEKVANESRSVIGAA